MDPYREQIAGTEADRSVIIVGLNGSVVGVDRLTGQIRWENKLPGGGNGEVFLAFRYGVLAVSALGGQLFRLDYLTGHILWQTATTSGGRATILVEPDMIICGKGGYVDAFDHAGNLGWQQQLRGKGMGRIALGLPGNVAQADDPGGE
jgi:outer membrane protein assembly factor BamB